MDAPRDPHSLRCPLRWEWSSRTFDRIISIILNIRLFLRAVGRHWMDTRRLVSLYSLAIICDLLLATGLCFWTEKNLWLITWINFVQVLLMSAASGINRTAKIWWKAQLTWPGNPLQPDQIDFWTWSHYDPVPRTDLFWDILLFASACARSEIISHSQFLHSLAIGCCFIHHNINNRYNNVIFLS